MDIPYPFTIPGDSHTFFPDQPSNQHNKVEAEAEERIYLYKAGEEEDRITHETNNAG